MRPSRVDRGNFNSAHWGDPLADLLSAGSNGNYTAKEDPGSLYTIENAIGARDVWSQTDAQKRQITGQGVTVALLDSGTAAVPGLTGANKLTYGPDLSIESNGVLTDQDTYGHGTHLAGIIAAHDGGPLTAKAIKALSPNTQLGVAPDAELESIKLATTDGSTDVSQVIAALNWITEHQTAADGSRVRVVNLSFGTDSVQPYQLDPLAAAAENAWKHGLVVVVSAGNDGQSAPNLSDPAIDPYVIAVGASDSDDSISGWNHPDLASFSSGGSAARHADLVAPGTSITSLRDPGSFVDQNHPEGLVDGDTSGRLFRGSGTSQAAAVVSGAVALLLQAYPNLTPDQVKGLLMAGASSVNASSRYAGAGELDIDSTLSIAKNLASGPGLLGTILNTLTGKSNANYTQNYPISTGQGSLQAARGTRRTRRRRRQPVRRRGRHPGQPVGPGRLVGRRVDRHLLVGRQLDGRPVDRRRLGEHRRRHPIGALVVGALVVGTLERRRLGLRPLVVGALVIGPLVVCALVVGALV